MPIQPVLRYPHPVLKKLCHRVEKIDSNILTLVQDLVDTMHEGPGSVGVAASQIGVTLRVCVVDVSRNRHGKDNNHGLLCMINPEITIRSGSATMREGCMSVPDYT
ncbi:MAG TPA: peptide deformylase, partial [Desulfuromonadales bacterium]|nr:peptide deformylase [Desulfuromonadales bacterium]